MPSDVTLMCADDDAEAEIFSPHWLSINISTWKHLMMLICAAEISTYWFLSSITLEADDDVADGARCRFSDVDFLWFSRGIFSALLFLEDASFSMSASIISSSLHFDDDFFSSLIEVADEVKTFFDDAVDAEILIISWWCRCRRVLMSFLVVRAADEISMPMWPFHFAVAADVMKIWCDYASFPLDWWFSKIDVPNIFSLHKHYR